MCFEYEYGYVHLDSGTRVAREGHRCSECCKPIQRGQTYHFASGIMPGEGYCNFKWCAPCERIRAAIVWYETEVEGCSMNEAHAPYGYAIEYLGEIDKTASDLIRAEAFAPVALVPVGA